MNGILACVTGRLVMEPKHGVSSAGKAWLRCLIKVDATGEGLPLVSVAAFGDRAVELRPRLAAGSYVYAEGTLSTSSWTDAKSGEKRSGLSLACWRLDPIGEIGRRRVSAECPPASQPQPRGREREVLYRDRPEPAQGELPETTSKRGWDADYPELRGDVL